jgi:hypothetical protein
VKCDFFFLQKNLIRNYATPWKGIGLSTPILAGRFAAMSSRAAVPLARVPGTADDGVINPSQI